MLSKAFPWARLYTLRQPVQFDELGELLEEIWAAHSPRRQPGDAHVADGLVGESRHIARITTLIERVATSGATVLITGESGTGKEVVARRIHHLSGRKGQFVAINCGAIPEQLLESELFGYERGAFTGAVARRIGRFELAHGGTLFLDEIGDMPMPMQVKLLRVLQEHVIERVGGTESIEVDVRIVAATHRDLPRRIEEGLFREDLYYRLNVFPIEIPPLRERPEDIPPLVHEMIGRMHARYGVRLHFTNDAMAALSAYSWPGNARELGNFIERLAVIRPHARIDADALPWPFRQDEPADEAAAAEEIVAPPGHSLPAEGLDLKAHLAGVERDLISAALERAGGVVQRAADELGVRRTTLVEKINRYGLRVRDAALAEDRDE
ncbi:MAG TPA: sigma 54-interacting transcriptional regulator [Woeseiaceae bacterium]|nr:sigma 54-interacting transcriptional regulator [Woeseiaceae bacterium]